MQNILEKNCVPYLLHPKHLTRLIYFMYRLFSKADSRKSPQGVPYTKEIYDILNSLFQKKIDAFNNTYNTKLVILDDNTPKFSLSTEATPIDTALIDKATFCIQRFIHSLSYEDSWKYKYLHLKKLLDTHPGEHKILLRQRGENLLPQLPDSVEGLRALADIKLRIYDNPQEAIDIYQTILASKEARTNDWERILFCYQLIGDNTRAQATLRQGLGRFCTHTELLSRSAYIHYQCGNLTEALNISQQLVMRNPLSYRYTKLLYRILYSLQKHSDANDALILYENNCKLQNRKIEAAQDFFLLKGIICLLLEKWQEASQCFSNIKVSKPWFTALHSIALEQSCQIQEAVRLWKDIPDSPNWRELRGLFAIRNHIEMNTWINIGEAVLQRDSAALFLEQLFPANEKERRTWILRDVFLGKKPYEEFDPFFYITHNKYICNSGINPLIHYKVDPFQWTSPIFFAHRFTIQTPLWQSYGQTPLAAALAIKQQFFYP